MRETVQTEGKRHKLSFAADLLQRLLALDRAVARRTRIVWGEHCTECAWPHCYSTCSFYTPRPDKHCRRFEDGIQTMTIDHGDYSFGLMRLRFRQWGKLESRGPMAYG